MPEMLSMAMRADMTLWLFVSAVQGTADDGARQARTRRLMGGHRPVERNVF